MILESGIKVLIAHRRLFESDHVRFFVGTVEGYEDGLARVTGQTWTRDPYQGLYVGKKELRTKIVPIGSGTVIVYQLPGTVRLEHFELSTEGSTLVAHDGADFRMDLSEGQIHTAPAPALRRRS